ncbi:MAG: OadG family protein [Acetatifactor sp.]|nr:OadG family protein [Acetatifactor sp.]
MKKFLTFTCMIACIFGLTACGNGKNYTNYEEDKLKQAITLTETQLIPAIQDVLNNPTATVLYEYTPEEVEYIVSQVYRLEVDGNAFISALGSFSSAYEEIGGTGKITGSTADIDGDQIIVNVSIEGPNQNAQAEVVLSNDFFFKMESASLNKVSTMGDSMVRAALNTVLGMGSVFAVLILISMIISAFGLISKVQTKAAAKKDSQVAASAATETANPAPAQEEIDAADDYELAAVIAAAIAASEGAASTDGFVVRSLRRRRAY